MTEESLAREVRAGVIPWPCWIEVDLDAIRHNVRSIKDLVGERCSIGAVVKAQAYGHGAVAVSRAALEAGATWLIVARCREGVQLRSAGIDARILVLGPVEPAEVEDVVTFGLQPTVINANQAKTYSDQAVATGRGVDIHVKIGTGLNRYGVPADEAKSLVGEIVRLPGLRLGGIYSHFATADEEDLSFAEQQLETFRSAAASLQEYGRPATVHMAASAATLALSESHLDMVRLGISLYGVYPSASLRDRVSLMPALSLRSRVTRIFDLSPGDSVGYGRTYFARRHLRAGLVQVGYADGLPRSHSNRGAMLINGSVAPLIGRISMDQCVVDLSDCGNVVLGSEAVVIGSQGDLAITIDDFARLSGTISYEALTSVGARVPRVYRSGGVPVAVAHFDEGTITDL